VESVAVPGPAGTGHTSDSDGLIIRAAVILTMTVESPALV
jgi:hypothetical protein